MISSTKQNESNKDKEKCLLKTFRGETSNAMLSYDAQRTLDRENSDGIIIYVKTNEISVKNKRL